MDEQIQKKLSELIQGVLGYMHLDCQVEIKEEPLNEGSSLFVSLYTPENAKFLIGKSGQNLKALEHIIRLLLNKHFKERDNYMLTLDVNDYRKSQTRYAIELAKQAVNRVRNNQKAEALSPMSPFERRVVHMELASYPDITTESIGEEPQRRVVIKPFP
ncbi:MAG: R3H domain-containing nucleic acid-binding protein [Candidatus Yanofskybacteria bacterium]|nr:R3H domain-containing nucleic acid-binding protein [Candidatus Yanofskybacteria bacterium]